MIQSFMMKRSLKAPREENALKLINKRKLLTVIVIVATVAIIVALLIPSWFNSPQYHNTQTPNTNKVKITAFTADMSWNIPVGVTMAITFNVTVQNIGTNDIDGVNITLERIINKTESLIGSYFYSNENSTYFYENGNLGVLHSGEIRKIRVDFFTSLDHYAEVTSSNFLASLKWNGTVLDERKLF